MNTIAAHSRWGAIGCVLLVLVAACSGSDLKSDTVLVSAAASLTDVFAELESAFESAHPEVDVVLNTGGSSTLREQILEGAPADIFASADLTNMDRIAVSGVVVGSPAIFATNSLEIAVPADNPAGVTGLADFANDDLLIGLCAIEVPCGALAAQVLESAGVVPAVDTYEPDVRALLTKIEAGELEAGIVYTTDVSSTESVAGVTIPDNVNVLAEYPIALLSMGSNPEDGGLFVEFVVGEQGQEILSEFGFGSP